MGLLRDLGIFVGILPIPRFTKIKPANWNEIEGKTNYEKLEELNGKFVWVQDFHDGIRYGQLKYNSPNAERYYLINSGQEFPFHVSDLENIGSKTVID